MIPNLPAGFVEFCAAHGVARCGCLLTARQRLDNLADAFVEDILAMSDEEILAEAREDGIDVEQVAHDGRALFERAKARADQATHRYLEMQRATLDKLKAQQIAIGDGSGTPLPPYDATVERVSLPTEPAIAPAEETQARGLDRPCSFCRRPIRICNDDPDGCVSGWRERPALL